MVRFSISRFVLFLSSLGLLLIMSIPRVLNAAEITKLASIEGITEYRLDNGLKILLFPDASRPTVTVNLTIFVGSLHEGSGEGGMAHLLEHMVFKGTPLHKKIPKLLQERGARFNGTTSTDRTNYYETMPASEDNLEFALRLEADRMINSYIKGSDLASEMTVVRNEFERSENSNYRVLSQRMQAAAYQWHNYGRPTIGNRSDIERVPLPKLRAFYRKYYQPDNAMVIVAGKFDQQKALELIAKYFGAIEKPARVLAGSYTEEPPQDGPRSVEVRRVGDLALVGASYHVPAGPHADFPAVYVLNNILATEPSGRMYKELVETKMAANVYGGAFPRRDPSMLDLMVEIRDPETSDQVMEKLLSFVEEIGAKGVSEEEVERSKVQFTNQREKQLTDTSRLAVSLSSWAAQGDWRLFFLFRDRIEQVTAADVKRVAAAYLSSNNRTTGLFIPTKTTQRVVIPSRPDVDALVENYQGREAVAAGEQFDASPDNIEKRTVRTNLAGGIKAAFLPKKTRGESVQLSLTLRYGGKESLRGRYMPSRLLPKVITKGTKQMSFEQLKDALDKNKTTITATASTPGKITFALQTKRSNLPAALELLRQIVREPLLSKEEFEVIRRQQLAAMEQAQSDPSTLASIEMRRLVTPYGKDDPRSTPSIADRIKLLEAVSIEDIRELHQKYMSAQAGELSMVGDFDIAEITPLLEGMLDSWEPQVSYQRLVQKVFAETPGGKHTILTPDKANAVYYAGLRMPVGKSHSDYPALVIGNFILGGGSLSSRLGDRVRQKDGLSYGVYSGVAAHSIDAQSQLTMAAISNPLNSLKVVAAIDEELKLLLTEGVAPEELERAKRGYLQKQEVRRTDDKTLATILNDTLFADRTMQYYTDMEHQIEGLTPQQVVEALRKHIDPKRLVIVVAGDFNKTKAAEKPAKKGG